MPEEQEAVTQEEQTVTSTEQTQEQQTEQTTEQTQTGQEQQTQEQTQTQQQVDERGVDYRNVAMEYRRKLDEMPNVIQRTVEEALAKNQQQVQKPAEYTVSQLEQYAIENPNYRPWVEEQKALLIQKNIQKVTEEQIKAADRQRSDVQTRQQTEQWVVNHPKFKDCFVTDSVGNKVWNMQNPLTQVMSVILNQTDPQTGKAVKDRPDGLAIAAEMAYGRYALSNESKVQTTVQRLQKDLKKTQKQTMTVGSGVRSSGGNASEYATHMANYQKTYSPRDAQAATKAYLKSIGLIKEQGD